VVGGVSLSLLAIGYLKGHSNDVDSSRSVVSLAAAEELHARLNDECRSVGVVALYQGALAYPLVRGITPTFYPGRWDVFPLEKVFKNDVFAPHLADQGDALFSLHVTQASSSESVVLAVNGEKVTISVDGAAMTRCFPRSPKTTVQALLESCSDRRWAEKVAEERKAAGLGRKKGHP
jgi:hypothetical protein